MRIKKFKGYVSDEPIVIELEPANSDEVTKFKCRRAVSGSKILGFLSNADEDNPAAMAGAVIDLLKAAVEPDEWDGFLEFTDNSDNGIDIETLSEIAAWVAEQYAGRPTESSLPSSTG